MDIDPVETPAEFTRETKKSRTGPESSHVTRSEVLEAPEHPDKGKQLFIKGTQEPVEVALDSTKVSYAQVQSGLNEAYIRWLKDGRFLGWRRLPSELKTRTKDVSLEISNLRSVAKNVFKHVLAWRMIDSGNFTEAESAELAPEIAKSVSEAFMTALYAKLRFIHQQSRTHVSRYNARPSYNKVVELPLPFALAIEGIGRIETHSEPERRMLIPDVPEGTKYECREEEEFDSFNYQTYMNVMRDLKIPLKSIIPQTQTGNPWWTYKVLEITKKLNLQCTLPPSHYTEYSAHLRSVFLGNAFETKVTQIVDFTELKHKYGTMFRERDIGFNRLAFEALCQSPEEDWNLNSG